MKVFFNFQPFRNNISKNYIRIKKILFIQFHHIVLNDNSNMWIIMIGNPTILTNKKVHLHNKQGFLFCLVKN